MNANAKEDRTWIEKYSCRRTIEEEMALLRNPGKVILENCL
jgi:hypothetical protein